MGHVLTFTPTSRASARPRAGDGSLPHTAQILFYTGVRYQRMSEPAPGASSPTSDGGLSGKRKRKRG